MGHSSGGRGGRGPGPPNPYGSRRKRVIPMETLAKPEKAKAEANSEEHPPARVTVAKAVIRESNGP